MVRETMRSGGTPPHLPSLDRHDHRQNGHTSGSGSGSGLRGSHHSRVPDIAARPLNTMLPLMVDGSEHPEPYFMTPNVVLDIGNETPPWLALQKSTDKNLYNFWRGNTRFQDAFIEEFIKDALYLEISGIVSGQQVASNSKNAAEGRIGSFLHDHVITDEVFLQIEELVWEVLWDDARKLSRDEAEDLDAIYRQDKVDPHVMKVLRDNYTRPINPRDGQTVVGREYGELLYHLNRLMQRGSLMENYAIKKLQEQIITQVAAKVVLDEAVKFMEDEMAAMDEEERLENPPRRA